MCPRTAAPSARCLHVSATNGRCWSSRQEPGRCCQRPLDQRRSQSDRRRNGQLSSISSVPALAQRSLGGGGRPPTILKIVGPAPRYFSAWARNFNSQAALPMSPLAADAASRLALNSRRDAFFTLPRSLNSVVVFNTLFMISPICRFPRLPRPRGLGQTPFLNWECFGGLP